MSRIKYLTLTQTGMQQPDRWQEQRVFLGCRETGNMRPTIDRCSEYVLRLLIEQTFWANKAQLSFARDDAAKALAVTLYGDFLADISRARLAVRAGDPDAVLKVLAEMEDRVVGDAE